MQLLLVMCANLSSGQTIDIGLQSGQTIVIVMCAKLESVQKLLLIICAKLASGPTLVFGHVCQATVRKDNCYCKVIFAKVPPGQNSQLYWSSVPI